MESSMTLLKVNLSKADPKYQAFVDVIIKTGVCDEKSVIIPTTIYYSIAKANEIPYEQALAIAVGISPLKVKAGMATGLAKTLVKSAVTAMTGGQVMVTPEQKAERVAICTGDATRPACESYIVAEQRCAECGCPRRSKMPDKWDFVESTCPKDKWPKLN